MRRLIVVALAILSVACGAETDAAGVEPAIVHVVPTSKSTGTGTFTIFLPPDADGSAEVWIFDLHLVGSGIPHFETPVDFPITVEPGDLVRIPFAYGLAFDLCEHELHGSVFDSRSEALTFVSSPAVLVSECQRPRD